MGALEQRLGEESGAPSALLLPIPVDGGSGEDGDPLAKLKTDIAKAKGRPITVKTQRLADSGKDQGVLPNGIGSRVG